MNKKILAVILLCIPLLWGGYYEFVSPMLSCGLIITYFMTKKKGHFQIQESTDIWMLLVILICMIVSVPIALDKGTALIGVIKYFPVFLFYVLWQQLHNDTRDKIWKWIPFSGSVMVTISCICYPIDALKDYFFRAERLGGFFQYSNTFALYLLIGITILLYIEEYKKIEIIEMAILLFGILITASRSIFVLLIVTLIYFFFSRKEKRFFYIKGVGLISVIAVVATFMTGQITTLTRLFRLSIHSSTLIGRILYWKDALPLIGKQPLGLGYLGYYFIQPQIQTGEYTVRYVHNDWLQISLDFGILAAIVMAVLVIRNVFSKTNKIEQKHILLLIAIHSIFDFNMEFICIALIAVMCLEIKSKRVREVPAKIVYSAGTAIMMISVYFVIALGADYVEQYEFANKMYPYNTLSLEHQMNAEESVTKASELADKINRQNGMRVSAYEVAAFADLQNEKQEQLIEDGNQMLLCAGYQMDYYEKYVVLLSKSLDQAMQQENEEAANRILEEIQSIRTKIDGLKERTSDLAYQTVDAPIFKLDDSVEDYLNNLSRLHF